MSVNAPEPIVHNTPNPLTLLGIGGESVGGIYTVPSKDLFPQVSGVPDTFQVKVVETFQQPYVKIDRTEYIPESTAGISGGTGSEPVPEYEKVDIFRTLSDLLMKTQLYSAVKVDLALGAIPASCLRDTFHVPRLFSMYYGDGKLNTLEFEGPIHVHSSEWVSIEGKKGSADYVVFGFASIDLDSGASSEESFDWKGLHYENGMASPITVP